MIENLVFVGFHSQVAGLHRETGEIVWRWKSGKGKGYTSLLLDGDRLIVSVMGYTYCLEAGTGKQLWFNELSGMGMGVTSLASVRGTTLGVLTQAAAEEAERQSSAEA